MKLYEVKYKVWNSIFSDLQQCKMLSVGNDREEAISKVKEYVDKDARDFMAEEIIEVFGYKIIVMEDN